MFACVKTSKNRVSHNTPAYNQSLVYANPIVPYFVRIVALDSVIWPALLDLLNYLSEKLFTASFNLRLGDAMPEDEPAEELHIFTPVVKPKYLSGVIVPGVQDWEYRFSRPRTFIEQQLGNVHLAFPLDKKEIAAMQGVNVYINAQEGATHIDSPIHEEVYVFLRNGFYWADLKEELAYRTGNTGVQG